MKASTGHAPSLHNQVVRIVIGGLFASFILASCGRKDEAPSAIKPETKEAPATSSLGPSQVPERVISGAPSSSLGGSSPQDRPTEFMPQDSVVKALVREFFDGQPEQQRMIADRLLELGTSDAVQGLLHITLSLPPGELKSHICQQLSGLETREKRDFLLGAIPYADGDVRRALAHAVGAQADSDLVLAVVDQFDNAATSQIRSGMLQVLGDVTSPDATAALAAVVGDQLNGMSDPIVHAAAQSLSRTANAPAVNALVGKLNSSSNPKDAEILSEMVSGITNPSAESALNYAARGSKNASNPTARLAAARALANFPSAESLATLQQLQSDANPEIQTVSRELAGKMQLVLGR